MNVRRVALAAVAALLFVSSAFATISPDLVISQVYGAGGNTGAAFTNDYIEIFNRGNATASLGGKSLQYASTTGTGSFGGAANQITVLPNVSLGAGQYFLVREASGGAIGSPLPAPDMTVTTNAINMSGTTGKIALVNSTTGLGCNGSSNVCNSTQLALIIDLVGYGTGTNFFEGSGPTPTISATNAAFRGGRGCTDTDNNASDFTAAPAAPRNTASALHPCNVTLPTSPSATGSASPNSLHEGESTLLTVTVVPGTNPTSSGISVTANLSAIGGANGQLFANAGGNNYTFNATVAAGTSAGAKTLPVTVTDAESRTGTASIALTVLTSAPTNPAAAGTATPANVARGASTLLTVNVTPGTNPASSGITVTGDLSSIGGSASQSFAGSGNVFTFNAAIPFATTLGAKSLPISVTDAQSRSASTNISLTVTAPTIPAGTIVISQFYGGGGNSGSTLRNDFIELFNRSNSPVSVDGWSVQHYSASSPTPAWLATPLSGVIQPHSYYLVQEAAGTTAGGGSVLLPTPDAVGDIPMGSTAGLVALSSSTTTPADQCSLGSDILDFVGYGGTNCSGRVAIGNGVSNTTAASRVLGGCKYTPSATDFTVGPPAPRNSATAQNDCSTVVETFPPHVMISQLYGGGGNAGASFSNDFIELYNPTDADVSLEGWSIQYASALGSGWGTNSQPLGGSIPTHGYFLIQLAGGTANPPGASLPPPRIIGDINMSATSGKLALVNNFVSLTGNCPIGNPALVDFIGYGTVDCFEGGLAAITPGNNATLVRASNADTNQNSTDFSKLTPPNPRGTGELVELPPLVKGFTPASASAPFDASIQIDFSEPVNVASGWFVISCGTTGAHTDVEVASAFNSRTWIITPNQTFTPGETCTVQIFKNLVTDQDTDDGPNNDTLPNDFQASFTIATGTPVETASVHLTMGNPSSAIDSFATPNNFLMAKPDFAMSYSRDKGTANWVSWHLSSDWFTSGNRTDTFRPDPALPPAWYRVLQTDYSGSGFDRGHMCPSADRSITIPINQATFLMSNMVPQTPENNQGPWEQFEGYLRTLTTCPGPCNELYIVSGPTGSLGTIANGHVTVPASTWKIVLVLPKLDGNDIQRISAATRTIAINIPNIAGIRETSWLTYLTTVSSVEQLTGYNFFSNVPQIVQNSIEAGSNGTNPPGVANETASTDEDQPVNVALNAVSPDPAATYSYTINTSPAHGSLSASGATYTYTPAPNYNGTDSVSFSVNDGHATSNTATVSITIYPVNDLPVLTSVPTSMTIDELTNASFTAQASDVDGDSVTFSLIGAPAGATIASNGAFSWTPTEAQGPASYTFTVRASDGTASADAPVTIVVNEVNTAPVLASISSQTVVLGNALTFTASATDSDVPAQTIVYGLSSAPAGASINTATGAFTWAPSGAQAGLTFNFTVTASDGVATTSTPVTARVVDDAAPVISPLTLNITQLWPANHKMVGVTVTYSVTDAGDTAPSCTLHVTSNEPIDGLGDGDTAPDWSIVDAHHVQLRAERAGNGTGRVYTIGADCTDRFGNLSHSATVTVSVPLNQNGK